MYRNYLKNIKAKQIPYKVLKKGDSLTLGGASSYGPLAGHDFY